MNTNHPPAARPEPQVATVGGIGWTRRELIEGGGILVTGRTGCGKGSGFVRPFIASLLRGEPGCGGLILGRTPYGGRLADGFLLPAFRSAGREGHFHSVFLDEQPENAPGLTKFGLFGCDWLEASEYAERFLSAFERWDSYSFSRPVPPVDPVAGALRQTARRLLTAGIESLRARGQVPTAGRLLSDMESMVDASGDSRPEDKAAFESVRPMLTLVATSEVDSDAPERFDFAELDRGHFLAPQVLKQRNFINAILLTLLVKELFHAHVFQRTDAAGAGFGVTRGNLLLLLQDDPTPPVFNPADFDVPTLAAFGVAVITATQSFLQVKQAIMDGCAATVEGAERELAGRRKLAERSLRFVQNRVVFGCATQEDAEEAVALATHLFGTVPVWRVTLSVSGGKMTQVRNRVEADRLQEHILRLLPDFHAVVLHARGFVRESYMEPRDPSGRIASWVPWRKRLAVWTRNLFAGPMTAARCRPYLLRPPAPAAKGTLATA